MPIVLKTLLSTLKGIAWSFLGEKIMAKVVWWFLEKATSKTTNKIDEKVVAMAKAKYYGYEYKHILKEVD